MLRSIALNRALRILLLMVAAVALLAGCGSDDSTATSRESATASGAVTPAPKPFDAPADKTPDGKSQFAPFQGLLVHFKNWGQGKEALVFIHGWSCDMSFWREQQPEFAKSRRVILIDLPGHGQSGKPLDFAYNIETFADSVAAVLKEAGVERAVLVGHSMGFPVARWLGLKRPGLVKAVVSVDGAVVRFPNDDAKLAKKRADFSAFVASLKGEDYKERAASFIDSLRGEKTPAALFEEIKAKMLTAPQHVMAGSLERFCDLAFWPETPLDVPALAVYAQGARLDKDFSQYLKKLLPQVEYQEWTGVDHFLMLEEPARFNQALADFLKRRNL